jgi:hypothetical protein
MVALGVPPPDGTLSGDIQTRIDEIISHNGLAIIAHPDRMGFTNVAELTQLSRFQGMELQNRNDTAKWDAVLSTRLESGGPPVWAFMSDDFHYGFDAGLRFIMLQTPELNEESLYSALRRGGFYWGTAALISGISVDGNHIKVTAVSEVSFRAVGRDGRVLQEVHGRAMDYIVDGTEGYVRVEVESSGYVAGTQPFFVKSATGVSNPYEAGGPWHKGNLHAHTTDSDGLLAREQVIETYRELGYSFLAITDHVAWEVPWESESSIEGWIQYDGQLVEKYLYVEARTEGEASVAASTVIQVNGSGIYGYCIPYVPDGVFNISAFATITGSATPLTGRDIQIHGAYPQNLVVIGKVHLTDVDFAVEDLTSVPAIVAG